MNKKVTLSLLSATVFASMAASAFAAPTQGVYMGGSVDKFYKLDDLFNLTAEAKKQFVTNLNTANPDGDFNNLVFVDFDGKGAKFSEILAKGTLSKAKRDLTKTDFEGSYVTVNLDGSNGVSYDPRNDAVDVPTGDLKVESVSAINAKQIEIKFTKAVDADTVIDADNDTLLDDVLTVKSLDDKAVTINDALAELSKDGKVLTLTADGDEIFDGRYDVTVAQGALKATDGTEVNKFTVTINVDDATAPVISGTTKVDASVTKVNFSEPIMNKGEITYKLADGTAINPEAEGYEISSDVDGSDVVFTLSGTKLVNKDVTVTFVGTSDWAGNLVDPNPATVVIKKGDKDGVAPTVKSVEFINNKTLVVEFSEQVAGFDKNQITVNRTKAAKVTRDLTNKAKYKVELQEAVSDIVTVEIESDNIEDLSGEEMAADYSKRIVVSADTVNPTVQGAKVTKGTDNAEYLTLTFSEDVTKVIEDDAELALEAKQLKDYVTKNVTLTATGADLVAVKGTKNQFMIKLASVKIGEGTLVEGAKYTVDLPADLVEDVAENNNLAKAAAFEFTRGKDGVPSSSQYQQVAENGVNVGEDNNTVTVEFTHVVDGASATNKDNYSIVGATITSVELSDDEKTVTLNLAKDSVTYSGSRYITINGVKTKAGVGLEKAFKQAIELKENVRPTLVSAIANGEKEITLTFSEAVVVGDDSDADFAVYFNGKIDGTGVAANPVVTNPKKVTITTTATIDAAALAAGVTVKAADSIDVKDANGNPLNFTGSKGVTLE